MGIESLKLRWATYDFIVWTANAKISARCDGYECKRVKIIRLRPEESGVFLLVAFRKMKGKERTTANILAKSPAILIPFCPLMAAHGDVGKYVAKDTCEKCTESFPRSIVGILALLFWNLNRSLGNDVLRICFPLIHVVVENDLPNHIYFLESLNYAPICLLWIHFTTIQCYKEWNISLLWIAIKFYQQISSFAFCLKICLKYF